MDIHVHITHTHMCVSYTRISMHALGTFVWVLQKVQYPSTPMGLESMESMLVWFEDQFYRQPEVLRGAIPILVNRSWWILMAVPWLNSQILPQKKSTQTFAFQPKCNPDRVQYGCCIGIHINLAESTRTHSQLGDDNQCWSLKAFQPFLACSNPF